MKSMYYVTLLHGAAFAYEIERLWTTVASNKHNIIPILEFLISLGLQEITSGVLSRPGLMLSAVHACAIEFPLSLNLGLVCSLPCAVSNRVCNIYFSVAMLLTALSACMHA